MRVLVAGASGAIGRALLPALRAAGHDVIGMARSERGRETVARLAAEPVVADALDRDAVARAVDAARPDAVVLELTAIPNDLDPRKVDRQFAVTNRLRTDGTANFLAAGAPRVVSQSVAFAYRRGSGLATEEEPIDLDPPRPYGSIAAALHRGDEMVVGAGGTVLRYGHLYGPGTHYAPGGGIHEAVRGRRMPVVGDGGGCFSFVHVDDAASATVAAVEHAPGGIVHVVDDDPAPVREWLPALADETGAPAPRRVPALVARVATSPYGVHFATTLRGASNARAGDVLGWRPAHPSWRGRLGSGA